MFVLGVLVPMPKMRANAASGLSSAKTSCASEMRVKCGCGTVGVPPLLMRDWMPSWTDENGVWAWRKCPELEVERLDVLVVAREHLLRAALVVGERVHGHAVHEDALALIRRERRRQPRQREVAAVVEPVCVGCHSGGSRPHGV